MDAPNRFACTVVHPGRFPPVITDPFNPLRVKLYAEIDTEKVSLISMPANGKEKILANEPFMNIREVIVKHLSGNDQRLEIIRKSLVRISIVVVVLFICQIQSHLSEPLDFGYYLSIALLAAVFVSGPLFFVFHGGLSIKNDVVRFLFTPLERGKSFYLEVDATQESHIRQALLSANVKIEEDDNG
jgi:hypothetical protein